MSTDIKCIGFDVDGTIRYDFKSEKKGQPMEMAESVIRNIKKKKVALFIATNQAGPAWREALSRKDKEGWERYPSAEEIAKDIVSFSKEVGLFEVRWYIATYDPRLIKVLTPTIEESIGEATMPFGYAEEDHPEEALKEICGDAAKEIQALLQKEGMHFAQASADPEWRKPRPGMIKQGAFNIGYKPEEVLYVGDMDTDKEAAKNAGCQFLDVRVSMLGNITIMLF